MTRVAAHAFRTRALIVRARAIACTKLPKVELD